MNNNKTHKDLDLPQFINKLKRFDKKARILYNGTKVFYLIIIAFFLLVILLPVFFEDKGFLDRVFVNGLLTIAGLIIIYIYLHYRGKDYKNIDYSQTTYEMLKKTSERYKPFLTKDLWVLPGLTLMSIGISLNSHMGFWKHELLFWGIVLAAGCLGFIYWYFKWKPLKENADRLIREIES